MSRSLSGLLLGIVWSVVSGQPAHAVEHYDTVIVGGEILDGTGAASIRGDLAIKDGVIAALGELPEHSADRTIDAAGLIVAPGFIDLHSHADQGMRDNPLMPNKLQQGITTVLAGNCGSSPIDIAAALASIDATHTGPNMGFLIGHNSVREAVMDRQARRATAADVSAMSDVVAKAMTDGAFGLSTGLKYVPGVYSDTEEVVELARIAGVAGGIYTTHLRDEGIHLMPAMEEALLIGDKAGVAVHISHHKAMGAAAWGSSEASLERIDRARAEGFDVTADQYPYTASSTSFEVLFPPWAMAGGEEAFLRRLADPDLRARLKADVIRIIETERGGSDTSRIQVAYFEPDPSFNGMTFREILMGRGWQPSVEYAAELAIEIQQAGGGQAIYHAIDEGDVRRIMAHPQVAVATDTGTIVSGQGNPHPRGYGTFPRVLGRYVRELGVLSLPEAVRKMTGLPATRLGLTDRGFIRSGYAADLVIFDPAVIADRATFTNPHRYAVGIAHVFVNGRQAYTSNGLTGVRAGRGLRHHGLE